MYVTLYNNQSNNNVLNKNIIVVKNNINCSLKDNTDIMTPTIRLSKAVIADATTYNYMFIDIFKRYYYVNDIVECIGGVMEIAGNVDVLMTFQSNIKQLYALVERQQNFYNLYLHDLQIPNYAYKRVQTFKFPMQPLDMDGQLILAVAGKG